MSVTRSVFGSALALDQARKHRVLVVCEGNTCRSPVLACLLLREIYRIGLTDIDVFSAGSFVNETSPAEGLNVFATIALLQHLDPRVDANFKEIMKPTRAPLANALNRFADQSFDLIVLLVSRESVPLEEFCITAKQINSRIVKDSAWVLWQERGFPQTLDADIGGRVLEEYCKQTALLEAYAVDLAREVLPTIT